MLVKQFLSEGASERAARRSCRPIAAAVEVHSLSCKRTTHAGFHAGPIAITKVADGRQLGSMDIDAKVRFRAKPGRSPILKSVIAGRRRLGRAGGENPHQDVGTFRQIGCTGDDNRRADFRWVRDMKGGPKRFVFFCGLVPSVLIR